MPFATPLVSIIVPAYNAEQYIAETIRSVIDQTFQGWELLIVNDGSTDKTAEISASFGDERIHVIQQPNSGVSAARNAGLEKAAGKYVTFLDADDVLPSRSLGLRVAILEDQPDIDAVHGIVSIRDEKLLNETKHFSPFAYGDPFRLALRLDGRLFFNPCYMVRREKIGQASFQKGMTHCEDILFFIRLFSQKLAVTSIAEPVYLYRVSGTSAMSNMKGLIAGYFELVENVMKMPMISYADTIIMRVKITRVMLSWYVRNLDVVGLVNIVRLFIGMPRPMARK